MLTNAKYSANRCKNAKSTLGGQRMAAGPSTRRGDRPKERIVKDGEPKLTHAHTQTLDGNNPITNFFVLLQPIRFDANVCVRKP